MSWVKIAVGVLGAIIGAVWIFQGLNLIHGSGMSGKPVFSVIGLILGAAGALLLASGIRDYRRT